MRATCVSLLFLAAGCDYAFRVDEVVLPDAASVEPSVARWDFAETEGTTVSDSVSPGLDLSIVPLTSVNWQPDGLNVIAPARIRSASAASKITAACKTAGVVTVDAWITPATLDLPGLGPGRIFTISTSAFAPANVMLGQTRDGAWEVRLLTSSAAGNLELRLPAGVVPVERTHLALVYDGRHVIAYVNGEEQVRAEALGDLSAWAEDAPVGFANETNADERVWLGSYHQVEVFDRALSADVIAARFAAGP